jgi:hypothetical protein
MKFQDKFLDEDYIVQSWDLGEWLPAYAGKLLMNFGCFC